MNRGRIWIVALLLAGSWSPARAQEDVWIGGTVRFDTRTGGMEGEVCVRSPDLATRAIELNSVLRLERVDGRPASQLDVAAEPGGHISRWQLPPRPDLTERCLTYSGTIPRIDAANGESREVDQSGVLAWDGQRLRGRGAARWLPFPVDPITNLAREAVRYDLTIQCRDCATLYLNGQRPSRNGEARWIAQTPNEPFLLIGHSPLRPTAGGWIIADDSLWTQADSLVRVVRRIDRFYQRYLGLDEPAPLDLIQFPDLRPAQRGRAWAFFANPALGIETRSIGTLYRGLSSERSATRANAFSLLAHEAAHRYFAWRVDSRSVQRELFDEPLATLLELEAIRHFRSEDEAERRIRQMREEAGRVLSPAALATAARADFAVDGYRYGWAPLQLLQLFGNDSARRREILRSLLSLPPATLRSADYGTILDAVNTS